MTLISIVLGLALVSFMGPLDRFRDYSWFERYSDWLEMRCNRYAFWDGPTGVVLTLALPLALLLVLTGWLGEMSAMFPWLIAMVMFVYSLGADPNRYFDSLLAIVADNDEAGLKDLVKELELDPEHGDNSRIARALLLQAHANLFGIIFWFIILGMTGALLYALTGVMYRRYRDIHGGYASAVAHLRCILMWPSARLVALGFALSGSLEDALNGWRSVQGATLECSEEIIAASGLGALQFRPEQDEEQNFSNQLYGLQAMINRTLIIWLTVLGLMTIANWLS
ncbi:MAG: hypothetical protein EPO31_09285 [Gammaproteobacteria bacterium]|nr:MAG: hypothetical protein EPO31_09285 [Gammaproteobacteria bacterium]